MKRKRIGACLMAVALTMSMTFGSITVNAQTITDSENGESYSSSTGGENAVLVSGSTVTLDSATVTKTGDESSENSDFTGTNAAVLATDGANLTLTNSSVTTNGSHANGVFSYGTATINVSDSTITTSANNSGGIMVTGGGTLNASDLTVTTDGNSSASIRSDRGGGTMSVDGGSYTTNGVGSPAIYSTASVTVSNATLTSNASEAVVIEGGNSVTLNNDTVSGSNTQLNGQAQTYQNVMIYQSMSGDASSGRGTFTMSGGSMTASNGSMFYVTNTSATINLSGASLSDSDGTFLTAAAGPWGTSGSNGGKVKVYADNQTIDGTITVDSSSSLSFYLSDGSAYTGAINSNSQAGDVYVELPEGTSWTLTDDSYISSLSAAGTSVSLNGHTLYVNGEKYEEGTSKDDEDIDEDSGDDGNSGDGGNSGDTGTKPDDQGTTGTNTDDKKPPVGGDGNGDNKPPVTDGNGDNKPPVDGNGDNRPTGTDSTDDSDSSTAFTDVPTGKYYSEAVSWAVSKGIASGTGNNRFSPEEACSRGQVVTFLWRAYGSPEPETATSTFTDVQDSSKYYYKAVLWAVEKGITSGTSDTTFSPEATVTRGQFVTFIYRAEGSPEVTGTSKFTDVQDSSRYYYYPVIWAVDKGVTTGTSDTTFSPDDPCTRGQVVTFLYRDMK